MIEMESDNVGEVLNSNTHGGSRWRRRKSQSQILPLEIRNNLTRTISDLGLVHRVLATEANVSPSLVSNLLSGAKPVKNRDLVAQVVNTIGKHALNVFDIGSDSEGRYHDDRYASCITTLTEVRMLFGIVDPIAAKLQELQILSNRAIVETVASVIGQSIKLSELAVDGLNVFPTSDTSMILTILRRSQEFNLAAQHILESGIFRSNTDENIQTP